jgi:hypothetical protein
MTPSERILRDALKAIAEALREPAGGEFWTARKFLDRFDVFHGDLDGLRVLNLVAEVALRQANSRRIRGDEE